MRVCDAVTRCVTDPVGVASCVEDLLGVERGVDVAESLPVPAAERVWVSERVVRCEGVTEGERDWLGLDDALPEDERDAEAEGVAEDVVEAVGAWLCDRVCVCVAERVRVILGVALCVGVSLCEGVDVRDVVEVPDGERDKVPVIEEVLDCERVARCVPVMVPERLPEREPDCERVPERVWLCDRDPVPV